MEMNYAELPSKSRRGIKSNRILHAFLLVCALGGLTLLTSHVSSSNDESAIDSDETTFNSIIPDALTSWFHLDTERSDESMYQITLIGKGYHRRPAAASTSAGSIIVFCNYIDNTIRYVTYQNQFWSDKWQMSSDQYFSYREPAIVAHANGDIDNYSVWRFYLLAVKRLSNGHWQEQTTFNFTTARNPLGLAMPGGELITFSLTEKNTINVVYQREDSVGHVFDLKGSFASHPKGFSTPDGNGYVFVRDFEGYLHLLRTYKRNLSAWKPQHIFSSCDPEFATVNGGFAMVYCSLQGSLILKIYSHNLDRWVLTKRLNGIVHTSQPAVAIRQNSGEILIFARNDRNHLMYINANLRRSKWHKVHGISEVAAAPCAISRGDNIDVFVVLGDTGVRHIEF